MFGSLFEDEDAGGLAESPGPPGARKCGPKPPPSPRGVTGLCGIRNQGATCYLNSLLQTLLFTPEFRESLFQLGPEELGSLADKDKPGAKVRVIPIQLQRLFAKLLLVDQEAYSTTELTDSFGWTNSEELQQHDVQELNRILFSAIESSLVGTSGQELIANLYHGTLVNQIICGVCGRISKREEDFQDLTVAVASYPSLQHVLTDQYVEMEKLEGKNQYRCEQCNKLVNARKGARLKKLPPVLSFSLLRFSYDYVKWERYKETGKFTFPKELDMAAFCQDADQETDTVYELFSVVIHKGSAHGGHYHAYIRDVDGLGVWIPPEEQAVAIPTDPTTGKVDYIEVSNPTQLLKAILQQEGEGGTTVDKLSQALMAQTGVSWNKRFKKQYGPITRFLKKYDDIFELNPVVNWVSLKEPTIPANGPDTAATNTVPNSSASGDSCEKEETSLTQECSCQATEGKCNCGESVETRTAAVKNATQNDAIRPGPSEVSNFWFDFNDSRVRPIPEPGPSDVSNFWFDFNDSRVRPIPESEIDTQPGPSDVSNFWFDFNDSRVRPIPESEIDTQPGPSDVSNFWFDFNDSRVRPISESEIDTQYQGKESAYMLFYRRKSLTRPQEAKGLPTYGMQAWQLAEVIEENSRLQKEREEYEMIINTISIDVLVSHEYMYQGGALQTLPGCHSNVMRLTLDRRKSLGELKVSIQEMLGSLWAGPMCLHIAKQLPAGLHLYDCVSDDDSRRVQDAGIAEGTQLFVWDGHQVGGLPVPSGERWEPVAISVIHGGGGGCHSNTSRGFPKCSALGEVRVLVSELTNIPVQSLVLTKLADSSRDAGENPSSVLLHNSQDGSSLRVLGFQDGDRLLAESKTSRRKRGGSPEVKSVGQSEVSQVTLSIKEHCSGNNMSANITIDTQETIGTVKMLALSQFELNDLQLEGGSHLRVVNTQGTGPPLYEDQTVESVSLRTDARLRLQLGMAPAHETERVFYLSTMYKYKMYMYNCTLKVEYTNRKVPYCIKHLVIGMPIPYPVKPNLYEDQTVESVSLRTDARLRLQPGKAPAPHQMVLYVSMLPSVDDVADFEVLTDKKATVGDCLRQTCARAGIPPEKWHLRRTNWCGEAEDPLNDLEITLEAATLHHGDLVVLQEGRIPPKGFVCVPVYLYPSPEQGMLGGGDSGMLGWITAGVNSLLHSKPEDRGEGGNGVLFLGDLEISREATLLDLKTQLLTLPHMKDAPIPTPGFLRVRTVEGGGPARVLRGGNQTLKYLKINSATQLCVQVLHQEEDLSQSVLVLNLRRRIPNTREYTPEEELLWETCKGATPSVLKQAIADRFVLPVERVAVAKHLPEKFQWLAVQVPKNSGKPKGKKKGGGGGGKGGGGGGANLKKPPYMLKDGDTIGVKDLQFDPHDKDDFSTPEDDAGREALRRAEEEKKQKRQQSKNSSKDGRKERRPEVGITIHVDDFR
ncbi:ubiquitin carboxyl-terminal hydrolase 40-like [Branchiostoma floridae]|uniref:Ubiquitin carboxyl-terminal hydrolase 40-like n=1 Tax=Branchiostoma floridae TaxID=7739 RepID=A0A9J7N1U3_BRAFL|nr:ubiquitin carboxyl-terminal hydrolase 40-like [Branchiostoma floridae]